MPAARVLVAFGTRRRTLSWSVLWQSAVPVGLGLVTGIALGNDACGGPANGVASTLR
jgi:hypothetical protein